MSMTYSDILKLLMRIGLSKVAKIISFVAWVILPFWIWVIVLLYVGREYFVLNLAIFGLVYFVIDLVFFVAQLCFLKRYPFAVMKQVESLEALLKDPKDKMKVEDFKNECRKITLPSALSFPISLSFVSIQRAGSRLFVFGRIMTVYVSYSIMTFFIFFQEKLLEIFHSMNLVLSQTFLNSILQLDIWKYLVNNIWISLGLLLILSLYFDPMFGLLLKAKSLRLPKATVFIAYFTLIYNPEYRFIIALSKLLSSIIDMFQRGRTLVCKPFIDPLTLPLIVQKTLSNVEGKSCDISRWEEDQQRETDVDKVKKLIWKDSKSPHLLKILARLTPSKDLLRVIKEMQPITYLGVQNSRCVFFGHVVYDPVEKIRLGYFYFDTTYLKKEFVLIYEEEVKKQREVEKRLPHNFEDLIRGLK